MPDNTTAVTSLAQGDIHTLGTLSRPDRETLQKLDPDVREERWVHSLWDHLRFNINRKPFDDARVRRALFLVPKWPAMADGFYGEGYWDYTGPLLSSFPEAYQPEQVRQMPGWNPDTKEQDIKTAVDLLAAAGLAEGDIEFGMMPSDPVRPPSTSTTWSGFRIS